MTTVVQIEFRESLLSIRDEILQSLGHPVAGVNVAGSTPVPDSGTVCGLLAASSLSMRSRMSAPPDRRKRLR